MGNSLLSGEKGIFKLPVLQGGSGSGGNHISTETNAKLSQLACAHASLQ
jgi:hypothetical protein